MEGHSFTYKTVKTIFQVLAPLTMGIYLELSGPTLPDLKDQLDVNYEEISRALVARSFGYFVGSMVVGGLADNFPLHTELLLAVSLFLGALGTGLVPWCTGLWVLIFISHLQGIGQGGIDTSNNVLCIRVWGKSAAVPVHALHLGFGIGAMIAPQLARPFISERISQPVNATTNATGSDVYTTNSSSLGDANLVYPYSISSILVLISCFVFLAYYITERKERRLRSVALNQREEQKICTQLVNPASCASGDFSFGLKMFILIFLIYINIVGGERTWSKFLFSYAMESDHNFSSHQAAFLNSAFWFCFLAGRFSGMIFAKCASPRNMVIVECSASILTATVLVIWVGSNSLILWIFSCLQALALSPIFSGVLAWLNLYLSMKGVAVAVVFVGAATGGMIYQWVTGYLFEFYGPHTLMYVIMGFSCLVTLLFACMALVARNRDFLEDEECKDCEDDNESNCGENCSMNLNEVCK